MKRKVKRIVTLVLVFFMLATIMAGCSTGESSGDDQEVYELNVNFTHGPEVAKSFTDWAAKIEEESEGRVKFNYYFSNSLLSIPDLPEGVASGVADISNCPVHLYPGTFPLNGQILGLPFIGIPDMETGSKIYKELYSQFPEMQQEYEQLGVHMLTANMMAPYHLSTTKSDEIRIPEDLKGLKIITGKNELSELFVNVGAAPVNQPVTEYYLSLERGVADGVTAHFPVANAFGTIPLLKQHVIFGEGGSHMDLQTYIINQSTWDKLPDDIKKIFEDNIGLLDQYENEVTNQQLDTALKAAEENGNAFVELTEDEISNWASSMEEINKKTIESMNENGLPAQKIYEKALEIIESYK